MPNPPLVVVLLTALSLATACAGPVAPSEPAPAAAPSSAADRSTPAGYQLLLDDIDRELSDSLAAIARAPVTADLDQRVLAAAGVASAAAERLTSSPVPTGVVEENTALADRLREFGRELGYLSQRVHQRAICAGPAALDVISTAPSVPGLRELAAELSRPEEGRPAFRWGAALPPPTDVREYRLPNATVVVDRRAAGGVPGDGVLEVRNEGERDAVVMLAKDGSLLVALAVTAGETARLGGIADGEYRLAYTIGRGWDTTLGTFNRECDFRRFVEPTVLRSTSVPGGTAYTVQSVTLRDQPEPERGPEPEQGPGPEPRPDAPQVPAPAPGPDITPESGTDGTEAIAPAELPR